VEVLVNGKEVEKTVKIGVVGSTYTQIISGISKGEQIVLANLAQKVPSSSENTTTTTRSGGAGFGASTFGGGGGFTRGGFTGGGFGGGGGGLGG
jgi:hypothetical protein